MTSMQRRDFLKTALAGLALGSEVCAAQQDSPQGVPTRPLGKTGQRVPIIALGGYHIGLPSLSEKQSIDLMHAAIGEGVTFFDNCMHYNGGRSEELMGKALAAPGRRQQVFLMTKVCARDYETCLEQIDASLRRLQTDHLDLLQHHSIGFEEDPQRMLDPEQGALRASREAHKAGKVRYIGFSGHTSPELMRQMLADPFAWATCQTVLNVADAYDPEGFQKRVVPLCVEKGVGVLGMKSLGAGRLMVPGRYGVDAETCRRYTLSLPTSAMVCGIQSLDDLRQDVAIARNFRPMTEDEIARLPEAVQTAGREGNVPGHGRIGCRWYADNRPADATG